MMARTEHLVAVTHEVEVAWAEDVDSRNQPFTPTKAEVRKHIRDNGDESVYVSVTGPAVLKDGSQGRSTRYAAYDIAPGGPSTWRKAPAWMLNALRNVGVTW